MINPAYKQAVSSETMKMARILFPKHVMTTPDTQWEIYMVEEGFSQKGELTAKIQK